MLPSSLLAFDLTGPGDFPLPRYRIYPADWVVMDLSRGKVSAVRRTLAGWRVRSEVEEWVVS